MQNRPPRELTAVGTLGDVGASYTVYEKNWKCGDCEHENYARKTRCFQCRAPKSNAKPTDNSHLVTQGATGELNQWREALDPTTQKIYYYHLQTKETRWERPVEMGLAPHSTGWFGRGRAGYENANKYEELNARYLQRPARKQMEHLPTKNSRLEGAYEYNIWYDKYIGDHWGNEKDTEPAETKCNLELDAGKTKADVVSKTNRYFCIHFARGMCARGAECNYYHRLPTLADETKIGMMHDCFGRERHATDRDDMTGVGNFTRNSRTIYGSGLKNVLDDPKKLEKNLFAAFGDWGEVESVNVVYRLSICFVRFRYRCSAEFAKEAMMNQSITKDSDEILSLRWAYDDPNPVAKQAAARSDHDAIVAMVTAKGVNTESADFDYPQNYALPAPAKRQKIAGEALSSYPDTDNQYSTQNQAYSQLGYANVESTPQEKEDK